MKAPPVIRTEAAVRAELELLDCLGDIEIAMQLEATKNVDKHPMDSRYESLHCSMVPLPRESDEFKLVESYLLTNHAATHNVYDLVLMNAFQVGSLLQFRMVEWLTYCQHEWRIFS
jgi:poly [ADP-ribose] polymerase